VRLGGIRGSGRGNSEETLENGNGGGDRNVPRSHGEKKQSVLVVVVVRGFGDLGDSERLVGRERLGDRERDKGGIIAGGHIQHRVRRNGVRGVRGGVTEAERVLLARNLGLCGSCGSDGAGGLCGAIELDELGLELGILGVQRSVVEVAEIRITIFVAASKHAIVRDN
jgi:hypothetical protein